MRQLLLLIALIATPLGAAAMDVWDGFTSTKPEGEGTATEPYRVATGANLRWIILNTTSWGTDTYFLQTDDIDLDGHPLYVNGKTNAEIAYRTIGYADTSGKVFQGVYDGNGYKIKNFKTSVHNVTTNAYTQMYGLFGFVKGAVVDGVTKPAVIRNVTIENGLIEMPPQEVNASADLKVGLLVAALGPNVEITNNIIRSSVITAGDYSDNVNEQFRFTSMYLGGMIGDITSGLAGTAGTDYATHKVVNAVVEVDILLANAVRQSTTTDSKRANYNVGGIVGRGRRRGLSAAGENTYYAGTIVAPKATVSPTWGMFRSNNAPTKAVDMSHAYSGEYQTATGDNDFSYVEKNASAITHEEAAENRYFGLYKVYNPLTEQIETITSTYPTEKVYRTRTFAMPNTNATATYDETSAVAMAAYQGVSHARYVDLANDVDMRRELLNKFKTAASVGTNLKSWGYNAVSGRLEFSEGITIQVRQLSFDTYQAVVVGGLSPQYLIKWTVNDAEIDSGLTDAMLSHTTTFQNMIPTGVLKATLYEIDGTPVEDSEGFPIFGSVELHSPLVDVDLTIDKVMVTSGTEVRPCYIASVHDHLTHELLHGSGTVNGDGTVATGGVRDNRYFWIWTVCSDPSAESSWELVNLHHSYETEQAEAMAASEAQGAILTQRNWIVPYNEARYYRVSWCRRNLDDQGNYRYKQDGEGNDIWTVDANGNPTRILDYEVIASDVIGPKRYIFVYDQDKTAHGRDLGVTTFDGYDPSMARNFTNGSDDNNGHSPYFAVKTIKRAYELIDPAYGRDGNILVIMGYYYDDPNIGDKKAWEMVYVDGKTEERLSLFKGDCTIIGNMGDLIYDGALNMQAKDESKVLNLFGHTTFSDIKWVGYVDPYTAAPTKSDLMLYTNQYDLELGRNVKMMRYAGYSTIGTGSNGLLPGTKVPAITIIGGHHQWAYGEINDMDPSRQVNPGFTTLTFNSGVLGRVIGSSRNHGSSVSASHNVFGTPEKPHRVKINLSITHLEPRGDKYVSHEYAPEDDYSYDIGLVTGGQTDGTCYAESVIDMNAGYIGRFISGNISYGRQVNAEGESFPSDSYFGSTTLNLINGYIHELYGGSLGRHAHSGGTEGAPGSASEKCECYFYGRSILNIKGGTIAGSIYGASAGGAIGVGDDYYHTFDNHIPYYRMVDGVETLDYGSYQTIKDDPDPSGLGVAGKVAKMPLADGTILDFYHSYSEVNISGGTIYGDVYGGGHGYAGQISYDKAIPDAGNLYGNCSVTMVQGDGAAPEIHGSIFGAGRGSNQYYEAAKAAGRTDLLENFTRLGMVIGDATVNLEHGTVYGNVYGAGAGVLGERFSLMAGLVGNASVTINGVTVNGNIFGGSLVADVLHHHGEQYVNIPEHSGNTSVEILRGTIGNNIFGGCEGNYVSPGHPDNSSGHVYGSTSVRVLGGSFIGNPYVTDANGHYELQDGTLVAPDAYDETVQADRKLRTFNIYGGGYIDCEVNGATSVYIQKALLTDPSSIAGEGSDDERFVTAFNDLKYRRFCVYGGGYGANTVVKGNPQYIKQSDTNGDPIEVPAANVHINVHTPGGIDVIPDGNPVERLIPGQTIFDVAGGGYSGDVGYWTSVEYEKDGVGNYVLDARGDRIPIESTRRAVNDMIDAGEEIDADDYDEYINGDVKITVEGSPVIRKVCGGSFYASVDNADTHIYSGKIKEVYGGSLLGYVHTTARLQIGTLHDDPNYTAEEVTRNNSRLFILESVYGGNDVKGIVGTRLWRDVVPDVDGTLPHYGMEMGGGAPLFTADVNDDEDRGINMFIFGGNILGNVYGAGNGHYRGYYVPGWARYEDGDDRQYRLVRSHFPEFKNPKNPANASHLEDPAYVTNLLLDAGGTPRRDTLGRVIYTGKVYRSQPMVGSVKMYIGGNTAGDRVNIGGNVYGGGRSCTIGQWNTVLPFEDPRRLMTGGFLHLNFGSHVNIDGNLYLGVSGQEYSNQATLDPAEGIDLSTFRGENSQELDRLGLLAYQHWYFDTDLGYYKPGFPLPGVPDGNFGMSGEHMFKGYLKKIEINGDVELTFYTDPFRKDASGNHIRNNRGQLVRKGWVPGEKAVLDYDSEDVTINSIFVGGECGSMTNNSMMRYDYTAQRAIPASAIPSGAGDYEKYGSIFRITLPKGLTVKNKVVGGSENAILRCYEYTNDGTRLITTREVSDGHGGTTTEPLEANYIVEGGVVPQRLFSYDLIVHCDRTGKPDSSISTDDVLLDPSDPAYNEYTLRDGTHVYRRWYTDTNPFYPNGDHLTAQRYCVAERRVDGKVYSYIGPHSLRHALMTGDEEDDKYENTSVKMTIACTFDPQEGDKPEGLVEDPDRPEHAFHYGGIVYGGCFNSGVMQGDIVINCAGNMLGDHLDTNDPSTFAEISSLKYNIGRVFGGGYGPDSRVEGNTYVNLLHNFKGMNVFGGGCRGDVLGRSHVNYIGTEDDSYVFGAIYGGGLYGSVGKQDINEHATEINLVSGNVDRVYGGSCLGNLYGRAVVNLCEKVAEYYDHLDYRRIREIDPTFDIWAGSRLIVGTVFGGNDISGNIYLPPAPTEPANALNPSDPVSVAEWTKYNSAKDAYETEGKYSTTVKVWEEPEVTPPSPAPSQEGERTPIGPGKETPGSKYGYNGFPLVGNLYGGSNGNYGLHTGRDLYIGGTVDLAVGEENQVMTLYLAGRNYDDDPDAPAGARSYGPFERPHLDYSRIILNGGTVVNAYGGGDQATVSKQTDIVVNYVVDHDGVHGNMEARAGFSSADELQRLWNVCHVTSDEQINEVTTTDDDGNVIFNDHVFRIFGGNNHVDMNIQPTWYLKSAHVGSVYSGGNFGRMTYCHTEAESDEPGARQIPVRGIRLNIDSRDFHARAVYGGGRVGDVEPDLSKVDPSLLDTDGRLKDPGSFYGAVLEINEGVIDEVYGGNDVSGNVSYGTKVKITGAISGDVYCAGNGNYRYQYDPSLAPGSSIVEAYSDDYGGRYFILPQNPAYGGADPQLAEQKILAINSYRPNIERAYLSIGGLSADHPAYVRGNVYCGGNSSSVHPSTSGEGSNSIIFEVGDNVVLNGVFLGSNGENLAKGENMDVMQRINSIDLARPNRLTAGDIDLAATTDERLIANASRDRDGGYGVVPATNTELYSTLLDLYMRAVEVSNLPSDFNLSPKLSNAYIGSFYVGGNTGSMMTDKCITLTFPESLTIFDRIVGGSNNAMVSLGGNTEPHIGGLPMAVDPTPDANGNVNTAKVHLVVKSKFEPWKLEYPQDNDYRKIRLVPDIEVNDGVTMFPKGKCSVFGGCYNSGITVGDIAIDIFSDMVREYDTSSTVGAALAESTPIGVTMTKKRAIVNGVDYDLRRSFAVIGAGFGVNSAVEGNVNVRLLPGKVHPTYNATPTEERPYISDHSPSVGMIFGGSAQCSLIGNTSIELRDGMVLTNTFGGSEAAPMYGSTRTIVGWPEYYRCTQDHRYPVNRTDDKSKGAREGWASTDGRPAVLDYIYLRAGEIISRPLYYQLAETVAEGVTKDQCFTLVTNDTPQNFDTLHPYDFNSADLGYNSDLSWDDIDISVGYRNASPAPGAVESDLDSGYYGHGNIYGGGLVSARSTVSLAGQYTVRRFNAINTPAPEYVDYGGNSIIIVGDNKENSYVNFDGETATGTVSDNWGIGTITGSGSRIRDHISIGTGHYKPVTTKIGQDVIGKYVWDPTTQHYIHQSSHVLGTNPTTGTPLADPNTDPRLNEQYYEMECDGGIYGGGRKVKIQGFRHCDLSYYGYADFTPQFPKLLNTFQTLDLLSVTDCCLQLQGATDFATNSVDATKYSLTRIGELQLISSLNTDQPLYAGERQSEGLCNILHNQKRIRNYIAFFNSVRYVSAITSSQSFDSPFHGADGTLYYTGDLMPNPARRKAPYIEGVDWDDPRFNYTDLPDAYSYRQFKKTRIDNYYAHRDLPVPSEGNTGADLSANLNVKSLTSREFDQRNIGTAANMIGINNGYTLKIQGAVTDEHDNDMTYYGPATGVIEVKLMTLAQNEGGGYIFALNHHDDPNHFLESPGNFVFPGAAYMISSDPDQHYNYIYDDCFPMGQGYDSYGATCNDAQEVHYWYVNGSHYYYNVTLTAYTYNGEIDFTLDNNDQLIYLYGMEPGTKLRVNSISWTTSDNVDSDIQQVGVDSDNHYLKDYRLYLSVDKNPIYSHTTAADNPYRDNAFITPIPRAGYPAMAGEAVDPLVTLDDSEVVNNYSDYSSTDLNMPLLGISLVDHVDNTTKAYYEEHLKEPEHVRIELVDKDGVSPFKYVVNLTIKYLLGPTITGLPVIENGALPGEYIYANSFGVDIELDDDNMAVTDRNWYIVSPEYSLSTQSEIRQVLDNIGNPDPDKRSIAEKLVEEKFDSDRQVHIPAYWYRNGWHLVYEIVANNMPFYLHPDRDLSQVEGQVKPYTDHLVVHNYHRMRPYDGISTQEIDGVVQPRVEDLRLTSGARIYIEDDQDMAYFYEWLRGVQTDTGRRTPDNKPIDPQYGESLTVFLMADVAMPELARAEVANLRFDGQFHGMGHNINMGTNEMFLGRNGGHFVNTGFISQRKTSQHHSNALVFGTNTGQIEDCFFYNPVDLTNGYIIDPDQLSGSTGKIINCYTTSHGTNYTSTTGDNLRSLTLASLDEFKYGSIAYNLNRFYLNKRYLDGRHLDIDDTEVDDDTRRTINVVKDIYADGNFRFARWSANGDPTALRTNDIPNYHDRMAKRIGVSMETYDPVAGITGCDATFHNSLDPVDESRAVRENGPGTPIVLDKFGQATYEPLISDYSFFGQNLNYNSDHPYPTTLEVTDMYSNRVYRSSGYYGSRVDRGFHFNADAYASQPTLTAIDFTGFRVAEYNSTYRKGEFTRNNEVCYYPPILDMPVAGIESFTTDTREKDRRGIEIDDDHVSRNLLVYDWAGDNALSPMEYLPSTPVNDIYCHVLHPVNNGTGLPRIDDDHRPTARLLHLIDREDYNCPIAFEVTDSAWYQRRPDVWAGVNANGYTGWDGVFIPFTAHKVYAESADGSSELDHGELTHFYDPYEALDQEAPSHEYWLRKFTGMSAEGKALFHRPASTEDLVNPQEAERRNYYYNNSYFSRAYGNVYDDGTTHSRPEYRPNDPSTTDDDALCGRTYNNYPLVNKGYPYIVAWPGEKFYEFDLSGHFYHDLFPIVDVIPQVINFLARGSNETDDQGNAIASNVVFNISDLEPTTTFEHDNYSISGTYMHRGPDSRTAVVDGLGANFERCDANGRWAVDPFRVYMTMPTSNPAPMPISSRGIGSDNLGEHDEEEPTDDSRLAQLEIFVEDNTLVIMSPFEESFDMPLYDVNGRLLRNLHIVDGENRYPELSQGYYLVRRFKFRIL